MKSVKKQMLKTHRKSFVSEKKKEWLASETRKKEQKSFTCKPFSSMTEHTVYDKSDHCVPGQNGIWVKSRNDGEKWSRKIFLKFLHAQAIFY